MQELIVDSSIGPAGCFLDEVILPRYTAVAVVLPASYNSITSYNQGSQQYCCSKYSSTTNKSKGRGKPTHREMTSSQPEGKQDGGGDGSSSASRDSEMGRLAKAEAEFRFAVQREQAALMASGVGRTEVGYSYILVPIPKRRIHTRNKSSCL